MLAKQTGGTPVTPLWNESNVRFVWVDESTWHLPVPEKNYEEDGIHYKAFEIKHKRGVCYLDWDLITCEAALLIHQMPTNIYSQLKTELLQDLSRVLETAALEPVSLVSLIGNLEKSVEVTRRNLHFLSVRDTQIDFRSRDRYADAMLDPTAKRARKAMGNDVVSDRGQFYWTANACSLERPIPMRVYQRDNRFSIHGECTEEEVRHVLARVRHYCS